MGRPGDGGWLRRWLYRQCGIDERELRPEKQKSEVRSQQAKPKREVKGNDELDNDIDAKRKRDFWSRESPEFRCRTNGDYAIVRLD
jgi:hypothetical protein